MSYRLIKRTTPTARVAHRCIWCGDYIDVGELYVKEISEYCGDFQDHSWHPSCDGEAGEYFTLWGECEFTPYEMKGCMNE